MKKPLDQILLHRKLDIRTETIALLATRQLTKVAGGSCSVYPVSCPGPSLGMCVNEDA